MKTSMNKEEVLRWKTNCISQSEKEKYFFFVLFRFYYKHTIELTLRPVQNAVRDTLDNANVKSY